jgi:ketosteroid isomerase-like protein
MTNLEQVWRQWEALSRRDRTAFLTLLRQDYARQREAVVRANSGAIHGVAARR